MSDPSEDDKAERGRAEMARHLLRFDEEMSTPTYAALIEARSRLARMRYESLVRQGFSEAQALELCWRSVAL